MKHEIRYPIESANNWKELFKTIETTLLKNNITPENCEKLIIEGGCITATFYRGDKNE